MEEKPKKSNKIYIIIIIVLALALIGTGGYLAYIKMNEEEKKEPTTQEEEKDTEEEKDKIIEFDSTTVDEQLNKYLTTFLNFRVVGNPSLFGQNLLADAGLRGDLVNSIFREIEPCEHYNDGPIQPFPYVQREIYENKYLEFYGKEDLFYKDLVDGKRFHTSEEYQQYIGTGDYIVWNDTWGYTPISFTLHAEQILYQAKEKQYTLSGSYQMTDENPETKNGTFTLVYFKDEQEQNHIQSLIINE